MSGAQTYKEMSGQAIATSDQLAVGLFPVLVRGAGDGGKDDVLLATPEQLTAMVVTGKATGTQITTNTTPTPIVGLPTIPETGGYSLVSGTITAHDQVTRDTTSWNITVQARRAPGNLMCDPQGDLTPAQFNPGQGSVSGCSVSLSVNSGGSAIVVAGNANSVLWRWNLDADVGF